MILVPFWHPFGLYFPSKIDLKTMLFFHRLLDGSREQAGAPKLRLPGGGRASGDGLWSLGGGQVGGGKVVA